MYYGYYLKRIYMTDLFSKNVYLLLLIDKHVCCNCFKVIKMVIDYFYCVGNLISLVINYLLFKLHYQFN